jgi:hypothetical protein
MGKIDGNAPKISKSPVTRRAINDLSDIEGTRPRDRGSLPSILKTENSLTRLHPQMYKQVAMKDYQNTIDKNSISPQQLSRKPFDKKQQSMN